MISRIVVIVGLIVSASACANRPQPYLASDCYLGQVNEKNRSYLQICFVGDRDSRGRFLFYSESVVGSSRKSRGLLCKQAFTFADNEGELLITSQRAECGIRRGYRASTRYDVLKGMKFDADVEFCRVVNSQKLACGLRSTETLDLFHKVQR
ncbi:hypothetical protein GCM10008090_17130 [Arenicella chitinivorans]|uniref:Lipoprotein n=1 Tax=Arenicella chitinivorans TaxID=1329800 RepID=A0A918RPF0_9GAMM|nr:hypothetical protein [Arenicella chitinivorans]GHA07877.1 hypothetical protein GCM10008090_17130 [Arenicella chitinivorans]